MKFILDLNPDQLIQLIIPSNIQLDKLQAISKMEGFMFYYYQHHIQMLH